mgnify:CR=1 FL=1
MGKEEPEKTENKQDTNPLDSSRLDAQPSAASFNRPSRAIIEEAERLRKAAEARLIKKGAKPTNQLDDKDRQAIPQAAKLPFGAEIGSATLYIPLPAHIARDGIPPGAPRWRIELHDISAGVGPLGLDIVGDTVIGRGASGPSAPDLDLDMFGALERGVSRRHALLRPTVNHLYIIDLNSTNGTMHNAAPLGPGLARSLSHNDTVTLGRMTFTVKIIDGPGLRKQREGSKAEKPSVPVAEDDKTKPLTAGPLVLPPKPSKPLVPPAEDDEGPATVKFTPPKDTDPSTPPKLE